MQTLERRKRKREESSDPGELGAEVDIEAEDWRALKRELRMELKAAQNMLRAKKTFAEGAKSLLVMCNRAARAWRGTPWAKVVVKCLRNFVVLDEIIAGIQEEFCCPESSIYVMGLMLQFAQFDAEGFSNERMSYSAPLIEDKLKTILAVLHLIRTSSTNLDSLAIDLLRKICGNEVDRLNLGADGHSLGNVDCVQNQIVALGVGEVIVKGMQANTNNPDFQKQGCTALWYLSLNDECQERILRAGAGECILAAMKTHSTICKVQEEACAALSRLSTNKANQTKLMSLGAGDYIIATMCLHRNNTTVQKEACGAIENLAKNEEIAKTLNSLRAGEIILTVMKEHKAHLDIQKSARGALYCLACNAENLEEGLKLLKEMKTLRSCRDELSVKGDADADATGVEEGASEECESDADEAGKSVSVRYHLTLTRRGYFFKELTSTRSIKRAVRDAWDKRYTTREVDKVVKMIQTFHSLGYHLNKLPPPIVTTLKKHEKYNTDENFKKVVNDATEI